MSYAYYAANAPPGKLDQVVDADNADLHLSKIADEIDHEVLVNDFVPLMGIKNSEVKDVEQKYKDQPKTQRMEILRLWIRKHHKDNEATYSNLVKMCLATDNGNYARIICNLWSNPAPEVLPIAKQSSIAFRYLGCGYDVCGQYANVTSTKKQIFDLRRVPKEDTQLIPHTHRNTLFPTITGNNRLDYQKNLSEKAGRRFSEHQSLFSASVESSFDPTHLEISESGYVTLQLYMRKQTWKLSTVSREYMCPGVVEDFEKMDGKWLIETYGAAVVMGLDIGGRWEENFVVSTFYENAIDHVKEVMKQAYSKEDAGQRGAVADAIKNTESIVSKSRSVNVIGGKTSHAPGELAEWKKSVESGPAFMDFSSDGLVPIWELFPEHSDKLKKGFEAYLKEHKLNITERNIIEGKYVTNFTPCCSDKGSGAYKNLTLIKPQTTDTSWKYVGVSRNDTEKMLVVREVVSGYGALREPTSTLEQWQRVWSDKWSFKTKNYSCWIPKVEGFRALGVYCRFGTSLWDHSPPSKEEAEGLVVVHKTLAKTCEEFETESVWTDSGSFAKYNLALGRLPSMVLWPFKSTFPDGKILPEKYVLKDKYMLKE